MSWKKNQKIEEEEEEQGERERGGRRINPGKKKGGGLKEREIVFSRSEGKRER